MESGDLEKRFSYHKPDGVTVATIEGLRADFLRMANLVNLAVPEGREKSLAMTKLEEASFWSVAGLARG
jgi:hypothetical protein